MANLIEFFRMVFSYLLTFAVIVVVSGIGGYVGVKVWKPKAKAEKTNKEYIFSDYTEFDSWAFDCIKAFEKITSKIKEEDFLILLK